MGEDSGAGDISYDHAPVVVCKGKRSKRQRVHAAPPPPLPDVLVIAASVEAESSSSVAEDDGWRSGADQEAASGCVTEEEEDMALCLMLLARGGGRGAQAGPSSSSSSVVAVAKEGKFRSRRPADGADGEFVYECKTCGRCFPSFQALGGHRTSHKKPRLLLPPTAEEKKQRPAAEEKSPMPSSRPSHPTPDPTVLAIPVVPATPPKQESVTAISGASRQQQQHKLGSRAHECSICGAEFASGQALGGHMRRHRPLVPASASSDVDVGAAAVIGGKEKGLLELDLNMPAPCDEAGSETTSTAGFALLFPAPASSALVDCHY